MVHPPYGRNGTKQTEHELEVNRVGAIGLSTRADLGCEEAVGGLPGALLGVVRVALQMPALLLHAAHRDAVEHHLDVLVGRQTHREHVAERGSGRAGKPTLERAELPEALEVKALVAPHELAGVLRLAYL